MSKRRSTSSSSVPSTTPNLRVSASGVHGLGAYATRPLPAGAFLGLYEGRRYTPAQVAAKTWDDSLTYLFKLSNDETIDGAKGGNATRHLNHSCTPNCEAIEDYDEAGRMVLRFETLVEVDAGEELFIDYGLIADSESSSADYRCHCGSAQCRGTMLAPAEDGEVTTGVAE